MSFRLLLGGFAAGATALALATLAGLEPTPDRLPPDGTALTEPRYLDRHGEWLSVTYQNAWNVHDRIALHEASPLLVDAFLTAEDQRFYEHGGVDWLARLHAVVQNVAALRPVRGASAITEQHGFSPFHLTALKHNGLLSVRVEVKLRSLLEEFGLRVGRDGAAGPETRRRRPRRGRGELA